jgi:AcrR family transcriptional regulator
MSTLEETSPTTRSEVRGRIIEAAARLLRDRGPDAVTTRSVAAEAGVQAPTLYRLFGDKDGLLDAVAEHVFSAYIDDKVAMATESGDPVDGLRSGWEAHLGFGLANPAIMGLLVSGRSSAPSAAAAGWALLRRRVERVAAAGRLQVPVDRAVAMIHAAGTGTVLCLVALPPEQRDPGLGDAVYAAVSRAILTDPVLEPSHRSPAAAANLLASALPGISVLSEAERSLLAEWLRRIAAS